MLRAIWSGSISFGLVGIPVKAVPAQSPKDVRFELLHGECNSKTKTTRYCPKCEREVPDEEMVRGYQYAKGQYVIISPEEFEAMGTPAKRTLQILDFVDVAEVDPIYFEKPYFLQPGDGGERTYALLHRAMVESNRVGIGKVALREREHLALIRPHEHGLVMEILAFPDEVRGIDAAVPPLEVKLDDREMQMAQMLIQSMTSTFDPAKYHDEYREQLGEMIQKKVEGGTIAAPATPAAPTGAVSDLMEMLRRSLEATGGAPPAAAPEPAEPAAKKGKATEEEAEAKELVEAGS